MRKRKPILFNVERATKMKISICGSFGFGNVGDEAISDALVDLGASVGIQIEPVVIGRYEKPAAPGVIGLGDYDKQRRASLRGLPLLVSGGGIIENNSNAVVFRCAELLRNGFASRCSLFGISVEPGVKYDWSYRWRLKLLLRKFEVVYTRDKLSERTLNSILPHVKTETIGDLVLWLSANANELPPSLHVVEKYIAINLAQRWSGDPNWLRWISKELSELARSLKACLVFVPMTEEYDNDRVEHRLVAEAIRAISPNVRVISIDAVLTPRAIAALFAKAELVVSMRLHGCVIAFAQETACIGLGYHPKVFGFFETVGLGASVLPAIPPKNQGKGIYGYKFLELGLEEGQLVQAALASMAKRDFSMLSILKSRSASALLTFLRQRGASR